MAQQNSSGQWPAFSVTFQHQGYLGDKWVENIRHVFITFYKKKKKKKKMEQMLREILEDFPGDT